MLLDASRIVRYYSMVRHELGFIWFILGRCLPLYVLKFLKEFVAKPVTVGAIAPSSKHLARAVTEAAGVAESPVVVEFGPGTGAITEAILPALREDATFFGMEINEDFVAIMGDQFPEVTVHHDSAENTRAYLEKLGLDACDCIVSGLPWGTFSKDLQDSLLDTISDVLRPGGRFATYMYLQSTLLPTGQRFKEQLRTRFGELFRTPVVWRNLPPAIVYYVEQPEKGKPLDDRAAAK